MTKHQAEMTQGAFGALDQAADLLDVLIRLHDREADAEVIEGLRRNDFAAWFAGRLTSAEGQVAAASLGAALTALPDPLDQDTLDNLAAEYADIYLTHSYRVSPSGSVWLTEDHLERQLPMFDVRDWYAHYDITVPDWRVRADDHLVHELQFVSYLCRMGTEVGATDAARFLDAHVLPWVPEFCRKARPYLREAFYAALMDLTEAVLEELRDTLEAQTGIARDVRDTTPTANREPDADTAYVPGVAESW